MILIYTFLRLISWIINNSRPYLNQSIRYMIKTHHCSIKLIFLLSKVSKLSICVYLDKFLNNFYKLKINLIYKILLENKYKLLMEIFLF